MTTGKYLVGILYYGAIDREHDGCVRAIENHPRVVQPIGTISGCPYICIGRSTMAEVVAQSEGCEGLIFIDHDIIFAPDALDQIIESCDQTKGVVGAGYSMRSPGSKMIGAVDMEATERESPGRKLIFFAGGGLYPASYLGMGFTAIHRTALERIGRDLPLFDNGATNQPIRPFFALQRRLEAPTSERGQKEGAVGNWYGEDVSFCLLAHDAGVPVHMDTRARVFHKGAYTYGIEDCGLVVPILDRIEGVVRTEQSARASAVSPHPDVTRAMEAATGKSTAELMGAPAPAPAGAE